MTSYTDLLANSTTTNDYSLFGTVFNGTDWGLGGVLAISALTIVTCVIITRNTRNLRLLLLPVMLGYMRLGIGVGNSWGFLLIGLAGITWVVTIFGQTIISDVLVGASNTYLATSSTVQRYRQRYAAKDAITAFDNTRDLSLQQGMQQAAFDQSLHQVTQPLRMDRAVADARESLMTQKLTRKDRLALGLAKSAEGLSLHKMTQGQRLDRAQIDAAEAITRSKLTTNDRKALAKIQLGEELTYQEENAPLLKKLGKIKGITKSKIATVVGAATLQDQTERSLQGKFVTQRTGLNWGIQQKRMNKAGLRQQEKQAALERRKAMATPQAIAAALPQVPQRSREAPYIEEVHRRRAMAELPMVKFLTSSRQKPKGSKLLPHTQGRLLASLYGPTDHKITPSPSNIHAIMQRIYNQDVRRAYPLIQNIRKDKKKWWQFRRTFK